MVFTNQTLNSQPPPVQLSDEEFSCVWEDRLRFSEDFNGGVHTAKTGSPLRNSELCAFQAFKVCSAKTPTG